MAASIGFENWTRPIIGNHKVLLDYDEQSFRAWFKRNPANRIDLAFNKNSLSISATSIQIWCLVFNEGQLVYPTGIQQGHAAEVPVEEGMEVYVALFNNHPQSLADRLGRVDEPFSIDELNDLSQTWHEVGECFLNRATITRNPTPIRQKYPDGCKLTGKQMMRFFIIAFTVLALLALTVVLPLGIALGSKPIQPLGQIWVNVDCKPFSSNQFSNLQLSQSFEWSEAMMEYCLNGTSSNCVISRSNSRMWDRDCGFTGH